MNAAEGRTKAGFELQFGANHQSYFLLFWLLKYLLLASSTPAFHSRLVSVASAAHRYGPVQVETINFEGNDNGWLAYGSRKIANIYMATQIQRLYGYQGLRGYSLHQGAFISPNLQKYSAAEACAASIYAAVSSELGGRGFVPRGCFGCGTSMPH
ncbi:hypothetical protein BDV25DRAFT_140063 [Aspergillus avenaceus]|uniref:Uncharacterized protein n=1 Tax=Aspergillus avenaceus TaxID=36643 RepID=A0A5N6TV32_ASPAV|nr:hypothetical protein BDV25DRAFT_140063 [Aspergillus avenaceus]